MSECDKITSSSLVLCCIVLVLAKCSVPYSCFLLKCSKIEEVINRNTLVFCACFQFILFYTFILGSLCLCSYVVMNIGLNQATLWHFRYQGLLLNCRLTNANVLTHSSHKPDQSITWSLFWKALIASFQHVLMSHWKFKWFKKSTCCCEWSTGIISPAVL